MTAINAAENTTTTENTTTAQFAIVNIKTEIVDVANAGLAALIAAATATPAITICPLAAEALETKIPPGRTLVIMATRSKNATTKSMETSSILITTMPTMGAILKAVGGKAYILNLAEGRVLGKLGQSILADGPTVFSAEDYISTAKASSPHAKAFGAWLAQQARVFATYTQLAGINASHLRQCLTSKANAVILYPEFGAKFDNLARKILADKVQHNVELNDKRTDADEVKLAEINAAIEVNDFIIETLTSMAEKWEAGLATVEAANKDINSLFR